jgi:hypothetical protein
MGNRSRLQKLSTAVEEGTHRCWRAFKRKHGANSAPRKRSSRHSTQPSGKTLDTLNMTEICSWPACAVEQCETLKRLCTLEKYDAMAPKSVTTDTLHPFKSEYLCKRFKSMRSLVEHICPADDLKVSASSRKTCRKASVSSLYSSVPSTRLCHSL